MRPVTCPIVAGADLRLRPIERSNIDRWFAHASRPERMAHASSNLQSRNDLRPMFERFESADPAAPIHFAICTPLDPALIGTIGFHTLSPANATAAITYTVDPPGLGQGHRDAMLLGGGPLGTG